jgi:hypothetical protein
VNLIEMQFSEGIVRYTDKFQVVVEGALYPRQLEVANQIVQLYKKVSREDKAYESERLEISGTTPCDILISGAAGIFRNSDAKTRKKAPQGR